MTECAQCPPPNRSWLFCIWPILLTWKPWEADQLELPERFIQELLCQEFLWAEQESKGHLGPVEPLSAAILFFRACNKWLIVRFCRYWLVCSMFVALVDVFIDDILMKAIHDNHSHQTFKRDAEQNLQSQPNNDLSSCWKLHLLYSR